jgi:hypothetical protein
MRRGTAVTTCLLDCSKACNKCRFDKLFQKLIRNLRFLRQKTLLQQVESYSNWRVKDALGMQKVPEHEK